VGPAHRGVGGGIVNGSDRRFIAVARFFQPERRERSVELALEQRDPEIFLLAAPENDDDADPLDAVLELLPDVPAGKLAIAHVDVSSRAEVLALERAGIDAVLVSEAKIAHLVGTQPFDV
jgi:hypothetical protein